MKCAMNKLRSFFNPCWIFVWKNGGISRTDGWLLILYRIEKIKQGRRWSWNTSLRFLSFKWYWTEDGQIQMEGSNEWQQVEGGKHMEFRWRVGWCWRKSRIDSCRLGVFFWWLGDGRWWRVMGDFFSVPFLVEKKWRPGCHFIAAFHLAKCGGGVDEPVASQGCCTTISEMIITSFVTQNQMVEIPKWNSQWIMKRSKRAAGGFSSNNLNSHFGCPSNNPHRGLVHKLTSWFRSDPPRSDGF